MKEEYENKGHIINDILEYRGIYDGAKCFDEDWNEKILPLFVEVHNNALKMVEDGLPEKETDINPATGFPFYKDINIGEVTGHNSCLKQVINNIQKLKI